MIELIIGGIVVFLLLIALFSSIVITPEKHQTIITYFGQYQKTMPPGLGFKIPLFSSVAARLSMAIQQHQVKAETITKDKVTVHPHITVQYFILPGKEREAFYNIQNPLAFIEAGVFDAVRSKVPEMELDNCFHNRDEIAKAVTAELAKQLEQNGYKVHNVLVTDVDFDANVKREMNNINAAQRAQVAAQAQAEAEKIRKVTAAKADAEAMKLHGEGFADQRKAIFHGWEESVQAMQKALPGVDSTKAVDMVMQLNYMDTLKELGKAGNTKVIMLPPPSSAGDLNKQLIEGLISGQEAAKATPAGQTSPQEKPASAANPVVADQQQTA